MRMSSVVMMMDRISNKDIRETAHVRWFNNKVREEMIFGPEFSGMMDAKEGNAREET